MKNFVSGAVFVAVAFFCASTAWAQRVYKPSGPNDNIIGSVQAEFEAMRLNANEAAYIALLSVAKREYQGNIDIRDITWVPGKKVNSFIYKFSGNGKVISLDGGGRSMAVGVEGALARAANDISENFSPRSRIAIVQITAPDRGARDYMIGELEYILQQQGYYMVDRAQLDRIFDEQRFGATSDVDDNTAARMGKISGASVVITGRIDGEGSLRRLRLRALNTETAQVIGTASERL
jgi:hypothetical protein